MLVLFYIAGLYQARAIEVGWLNSLRGPIIWLCSVLDMPAGNTRELVAE